MAPNSRLQYPNPIILPSPPRLCFSPDLAKCPQHGARDRGNTGGGFVRKVVGRSDPFIELTI
ncbi:hypothetical protein E2C01_093542 [Portunus trituberculatus]|uniref:Uncharacterized protein n=1 Tax=Portunus trituberculatus TaxID=210409 RepID=A0A5B7JV34_PORTR|nr:hypothetical protein [Portunus trituberculatus]